MGSLNKSEDVVIAASQSFKEREYWLNQLSGQLTVSKFPCDFRKKMENKPRIESMRFELPGELFSRLMRLSNDSDSRLHMILVAVLVVLLHKYTENTDIILGVPVDKQDIDGKFINTVLALRNRIEDNMTFKELLLQVRETIFQAEENQNYPIEALLYDLDMKVDETAFEFPLFDVTLLLENLQDKEYIRHININMVFCLLRTDKGIHGRLEYNSLLYHKQTIEKITHRFIDIMRKVLADIDVKIDDLNILSEEERKELLFDFNDTKKEYPANKTLHQLFESQVEITPDHTTVVYEQNRLTYKRLSEEADRVAWVLRDKGVKPDTIVGIMVKGALDVVIGILGILKSGGAYLPLSLKNPAERNVYMLEDSCAGILITDSSTRTGDMDAISIITMDIHKVSLDSGSVSNLQEVGQPADAAYIIYTSGTTGKPKGVVVEHQNAVNTLVCRKEMYGLNPGVTALQLFSHTFDGFVTGFFTPVISGATVVLLNEDDIIDITRVKTAVVKNQVTHFITVPSLYQFLMEELTPEETTSLKIVTLAGDKTSLEMIEMTKSKNPAIEIVQEYGVTEAGVMSTIYRHQERESQVRIGTPIWNTRIYIIGKYSQPQPIGVAGELCLAGTGISRGYLNNPERTWGKFIEPKCLPEKMIYRTGDLARWSADGNIEFLGRIDSQVKLRGFRIELGEIESQLLKHSEVKEAVVTARETQKRGKYLCAYIVSRSPDSRPTDHQLRNYLANILPDYMIPAYFLILDRIPLNQNGKMDRKQLPEPDEMINIEYVAPRNQVEETLAEIWKKELNAESVGIYDNYFNIGGDSIKSIKLINIINNKLNKKLKLADLYSNNTIEKLAEVLNKNERDNSPSTAEYNNVLREIEELKDGFIKGI